MRWEVECEIQEGSEGLIPDRANYERFQAEEFYLAEGSREGCAWVLVELEAAARRHDGFRRELAAD